MHWGYPPDSITSRLAEVYFKGCTFICVNLSMTWLCTGIVNPRRTVTLNLLQHNIDNIDRVKVRRRCMNILSQADASSNCHILLFKSKGSLLDPVQSKSTESVIGAIGQKIVSIGSIVPQYYFWKWKWNWEKFIEALNKSNSLHSKF